MRRLIMWNLMTLDGFVAGERGDISWHEDVWGEELERFSIEQGEEIGALLFGRVTYELMAGYWPTAPKSEIADYMNALPKIVFSRTLREADWRNTRLLHDNAPAEVARLKSDTGKDIFMFGSADLAASLIPHGLIDEFRIGVAPLLLGGGSPLFKESSDRTRLRLLETRPLKKSGVVILRYEPTA
jgi:dihydrofolate reductase